MDLIKNYGSYENAKAELEKIKSTKYRNYMYLEEALLEYRRANNIFEVGDFVVRKSGFDFELRKIEIIDEYDLKVFSQDMSHSYWVFKGKYRHATPQEIQSGHRL